MLCAVITNGDKTTVVDLPTSTAELESKLTSIGINQEAGLISIADEVGDPIRIKLYSRTPEGVHLLRLLTPEKNLADANLCAAMLQGAAEKNLFRLGRGLRNDAYKTLDDYMNAAKNLFIPSCYMSPDRCNDFGMYSVLAHYESNPNVRLVVSCTHGSETAFFPLPMNDSGLCNVFRKLGEYGERNWSYAIEKTRFPNTWSEKLNTILNDEGLFFLNLFVAAFPNKGDEKLYEAVVEYAEVSEGRDIEASVDLISLANHLDYFDFYPGCTELDQVSREWLYRHTDKELGSDLDVFFDHKAYGKEICDCHDGAFVEGGFVCMPGSVRLESILDGLEDIIPS